MSGRLLAYGLTQNMHPPHCYAVRQQTMLTACAEKGKFYEQIQQTVANVPQHDILVILRDLNAKLRSCK